MPFAAAAGTSTWYPIIEFVRIFNPLMPVA